MKRTLLDISDDLVALDVMLDEVGGDVSDPNVESAVELWYSTLGDEADTKLDNMAALISEFENRASIRRKEAKRLTERARVEENQASWLRGRMQNFFLRHGMKKQHTRRYTLSIAKNPESVMLDVPDSEVPIEFLKVSYTVKKNDIKDAIKAGREISWAHLQQSQGLRIR